MELQIWSCECKTLNVALNSRATIEYTVTKIYVQIGITSDARGWITTERMVAVATGLFFIPIVCGVCFISTAADNMMEVFQAHGDI